MLIIEASFSIVWSQPNVVLHGSMFEVHPLNPHLDMLSQNLNFQNKITFQVMYRSIHAQMTVPKESRRGCQIPLDLELPVVLNFMIYVLGTELWSSARAVSTLNSWTISPTPGICILSTYPRAFLSKRLPRALKSVKSSQGVPTTWWYSVCDIPWASSGDEGYPEGYKDGHDLVSILKTFKILNWVKQKI